VNCRVQYAPRARANPECLCNDQALHYIEHGIPPPVDGPKKEKKTQGLIGGAGINSHVMCAST
jgi:hypothetical protein